MIDPREVFGWIDPQIDGTWEQFAEDLATLIEGIAKEVQTSITVQTHSEEYARNRSIEKIREIAAEVRAHRFD